MNYSTAPSAAVYVHLCLLGSQNTNSGEDILTCFPFQFLSDMLGSNHNKEELKEPEKLFLSETAACCYL